MPRTLSQSFTWTIYHGSSKENMMVAKDSFNSHNCSLCSKLADLAFAKVKYFIFIDQFLATWIICEFIIMKQFLIMDIKMWTLIMFWKQIEIFWYGSICVLCKMAEYYALYLCHNFFENGIESWPLQMCTAFIWLGTYTAFTYN